MNPGDLLTPASAWAPIEARALAEIRALLGCEERAEVEAVKRLLADLAYWKQAYDREIEP